MRIEPFTIDSDISASVSATLGSGDVVRVFLDVYNPERRIWVERDSIKFHSSGSNIRTLFYTLDSNDTTLNLKTFNYPLTTSNAFDHICRQQTYGFA